MRAVGEGLLQQFTAREPVTQHRLERRDVVTVRQSVLLTSSEVSGVCSARWEHSNLNSASLRSHRCSQLHCSHRKQSRSEWSLLQRAASSAPARLALSSALPHILEPKLTVPPWWPRSEHPDISADCRARAPGSATVPHRYRD